MFSQQREYVQGCLGLGTKFSRFIVVASQPFTRRNLERFGVSWLQKRGKCVHLVDLSFLVWDKDALRTDEEPDAIEGVWRPIAWSDFEEFLTQQGPDLLLLPYLSPEDGTALPLFELIARMKLSTLYCVRGRIPIGRRRFHTVRKVARSLISYSKLSGPL